MKRFLSVVGILLAVGAIFYITWPRDDADASYMEYCGEQIKLTRPYRDFDEYKNDPCNIDPSQNSLVEALVEHVPVPKVCNGSKELTDALALIQFPGYGLGGFGTLRQPDGSTIQVFSVEVPRAGKERFLVFRGRGDTFSLIDDFLVPASAMITQVHLEAGKLICTSRDGRDVLSRPLSGG
jgi:hypothetical protein